MNSKDFFNLVKNRKQTILIITLFFVLIIMAVTFIQPLKYRATTRLLIVQEGAIGADVYSISRANKFLSSMLSEVVYSNSFFENVLDSGYNIDNNHFSNDQNKKMKQWQKMVSADSISDTGMIVVNTYHQNKYQASQINQAIAYTLKTKHSIYDGLNDAVSVKVIDKTSVSNWPVKPNILLNLIMGFVFGLLISALFIRLYPDREVRMWPFRKKVENFGYAEDLYSESQDDNKGEEDNWHSVPDVLDQKKLEPVPVSSFEDEAVEEKIEKNYENFEYIDQEDEGGVPENKEIDADDRFQGSMKNVF